MIENLFLLDYPLKCSFFVGSLLMQQFFLITNYEKALTTIKIFLFFLILAAYFRYYVHES